MGAQSWRGSLEYRVKEFGICPVSNGELPKDFKWGEREGLFCVLGAGYSVANGLEVGRLGQREISEGVGVR